MPAEQLNPIVLTDLGVYGLNSQANPAALPPQWLSKADNIILDEQGRISSRKGIQQVSTSISGEVVQSLVEYRASNGTTKIFAGTDGDIYFVNTANTPYTLDAQTRTGTPQTITAGHWEWANFSEKLCGVQNGHIPVIYLGSSWADLDEVSGYEGPSGVSTFDPNCVLGEYGRLWVGGITENSNVVYYSDTLLGHKWDSGAAGQIDLKTVWGNDYIVGIHAFMGKLVIFGTQNIAIYNNPYDPTELALDELIEGVGLRARDSVAHLGDDIVFLSNTGVRSLARTVTSDGKMPLRNFSKNIRDELALAITSADMEKCKAAYCLCGGFYMLAFPDRNTIYYMDFTIINPDSTPRISKFVFDTGECPTAFLSTTDGAMWMGRNNSAANVARYQNYYDQIKTDISANSLDVSAYTLDVSTYDKDVSAYTVDVSSYDTDISAISLDVTSYYGTSGACTTAGYTWDPVAGTCTATYGDESQFCTDAGYTYDAGTGTCTANYGDDAAFCTAAGYSYVAGVCTATYGDESRFCTDDGYSYAGGVCSATYGDRQDFCEDTGYTWDGTGPTCTATYGDESRFCTDQTYSYAGGVCTATYADESRFCTTTGNTWESTNSECWSTTDITYTGSFRTTWLDFGNPSITKILKEFYGVIVGGKDMTIDFTWYRDYNVEGTTQSFILRPTGTGTPYLWGKSTSLYGKALFAPSYNPTEYKLPLSRTGKVVQIEMKAGIYGYKASLQSIALHAKQGKLR